LKVNKFLVLACLLLAVIASIFWLSSRYPALNQKALMGGESPVEALGFDNTFEVLPNDPVWLKITYNTANWVMTNRKGMIFGILFAAALMLLFALLHQRQFKNKFLNSLMGMFIGAPLGVCVNCAAPIAQGMRDAGARTETTLATMISSPTLNVIVMGIMFSLLPLYMVIIKLALTALVILVIIPTIVHFFDPPAHTGPDLEKADRAVKKTRSSNLLLSLVPFSNASTWATALTWLVRSYTKSLWHLIKVTVPLMLLAGLLGNILITLIPWESIMAMVPVGAGLITTIAVMVIIALIGVFLPVPISFDVIIAAILLAMGMQTTYVTILLVTLGIFSIYSFFIVGQAISWKISVMLYASIVLLGVCSGFASSELSKRFIKLKQAEFKSFSLIKADDVQISPYKRYPAKNASVLQQTGPKVLNQTQYSESSGVSIFSTPFNNSTTSGTGAFRRLEGPSIGIPAEGGFSLVDMMEPFAQGKGIATEDFNGDGYPDILFAGETGLSLWSNNSGTGFHEYPLVAGDTLSGFISNAAFADMNNDSWPDIVFTVYRKGYFLWYNDKGNFREEHISKLPAPEKAVSGTGLSIGDIDHDGDLDIAVGNWSVGWYMDVENSYQASNDALLINEGGNFTLKELEGIPGESLSTLITDFNNDGNQDIIVCNDYGVSDKYLVGDGLGGFEPLVEGDSIIPFTTYFSMSTATADIDNDLIPELYNTSISGANLNITYHSKQAKQICETITDDALRAECEKVTKAYLEMTRYSLNSSFPCNEENNMACIGYNLYWSAKRSKSMEALKSFCESVPPSIEDLYFKTCQFDFELEPGANQELAGLIPPKRQTNTFFKQTSTGTFKELSNQYNIKYTGWSWNAKFADLNNDEYQDLMVVNGFVMNATQHSNLLYLNENGSTFKDITEASGLINFSPTNSYVYLDYDLDGDLDILMAPKFGPVALYSNQMSKGNSIAFRLNDRQANFDGISARLIISYGDGKHQMREVQSGGGFRSANGYTIYFGLGNHETVDQLKIIWSTGEESIISTPLAAGHLYKVLREEKPALP
jgi:uncharacterized membrane protein YraQ (UPF0718 family)